MRDVLEVCLKGAKKTKIVYDVNLNFSRLNKYLSMLLCLGFVTVSVVCGKWNNPSVNVVYRTTKAGINFLNGCLKMQNTLGRVGVS